MADGNQIQSISATKIQVILAIIVKVRCDLTMLIALYCCNKKWCFHSINSDCKCPHGQCNIFRNNNNNSNILCINISSEINSAYWWGHNTNLYGKVRKIYPFFHHSVIILLLLYNHTNHNLCISWLIIYHYSVIHQWSLIFHNVIINNNNHGFNSDWPTSTCV